MSFLEQSLDYSIEEPPAEEKTAELPILGTVPIFVSAKMGLSPLTLPLTLQIVGWALPTPIGFRSASPGMV